jgi:hypothetical protein
MCGELEGDVHAALCCAETAVWRTNLKCEKLFSYQKEFIIKIIDCNNSVLVKDIGNYLFKAGKHGRDMQIKKRWS